MHAQISKQWSELSPDERAHFQAEANRMQRARVELMSQPLREKETDETNDGLRASQVHRLNNARLDPSLRKIAEHPCWQAGLALSNHVCALRPEHISSEQREALIEAYRDVFAYDGTVSANPRLPSYAQPCLSTGAGICRSSPLFNHVDCLVRQLDSILAAAGLRQTVTLVRLTPETAEASTWFVVGCVGLRPVVQVVIMAFAHASNRLTLAVENGRPKISTSHRKVWAMLQEHTSAGRSVEDFVAEAAHCIVK